MSRPVAVALLAAGCLTAAAGGAYLAVRQNTPTAHAAQPSAIAAPAPTATTQPVAETEAVVEPQVEPQKEAPVKETPLPEPVAAPAAPARAPRPPAARPRPAPAPARTAVAAPVASATPTPVTPAERPVDAVTPLPEPPAAAPASAPPARDPEPRVEVPAAPVIEEITVPASSVIGLEVETPISSERARVEDRVDARVTRDVYVDGKLAIPAGARMLGAVTVVERGGKVKERARLGIRFHTLVLADGRRVDVRTDTIFREGQSPANESSRKIGGAAVGGAVLGAIMGGGKGAAIGGAAGAAGGTAAVMAGGRNAATIATGTVLNARLASPVTIDVERR